MSYVNINEEGGEKASTTSRAKCAFISVVVIASVGVIAFVAWWLATAGSEASQDTYFSLNAGSAYPGYEGSLYVTGAVKIEFQDGIYATLSYELDGTDPDCAELGPIEGTANSCGIHIHEGTSCESDAEGHYYDTSTIDEDPWQYDAFFTDPEGVTAQINFGYDQDATLGRALVIHDRDGTRVTCDLLVDPDVLTLTTFDVYPDYTGNLSDVTGAVNLTFQMTNVVIDYDLAGTDDACLTEGPIEGTANSCGIHIHEGVSCATDDDVSGHFYDTEEDPWQYDAFYNAESGSLRVEYGYDYASTEGRAFVLHDQSGTRITCTLLQ